MQFMLVILITIGYPVIGEDKEIFELRVPQENKETCEKSAKAFKFSLPVIFMDTRCEPSMSDEDPSVLSISDIW